MKRKHITDDFDLFGAKLTTVVDPMNGSNVPGVRSGGLNVFQAFAHIAQYRGTGRVLVFRETDLYDVVASREGSLVGGATLDEMRLAAKRFASDLPNTFGESR